MDMSNLLAFFDMIPEYVDRVDTSSERVDSTVVR